MVIRLKRIAAVAILSASIAACVTGPRDKEPIRISAEIRPEINYVTHLYTLAGLGFSDGDYSARYGASLPQAAVDTLQKYRELLTFGQGEGGMLAGPFFFGVSSESIPNSDTLKLIIGKIKDMVREAGADSALMGAVQAISKVYLDNYDYYLENVFPQAKNDMEERLDLLNRRLSRNSFVRDWEDVTGYEWKRGDYHWLLYRAGEDGPSYNNLDGNTNTVWFNQPLEYQLSMFSHEFGIFLMQDAINPVYEEMKEYTASLDLGKDLTYVPWSAFESLSCWYNCKIAGKETEDFRNFGQADVETFCKIYDRLSEEGVTDPAELYRKGIIEYLKED